MAWFGRKKDGRAGAQDAAIADFWSWWQESSGRVAAAVGDGTVEELADEIGQRVTAIDKGLAWEVGQGVASQHLLTVTAEGDAARRKLARRWLRAAPPADGTWSYSDVRQAGNLGNTLRVGDVELREGDVRFVARRQGTGLDVVLHHPAFADMSKEVRAQVTFLCLDECLGEDGVELWVNGVNHSVEDLPDSQPLVQLRGIVEELADDVAPDGQMGWSVAQGQGPRGPVLVTCLSRLSPVQAPEHDQHVAVTVPYADRTAEGWPGPGSLEALRDLESHLEEAAEGAGQVVAVESAAGVRVMHFYVDSTTPAAEQIRAATSGWDQGKVVVTVEDDPAWEGVSRFRQ